MDYSWIGIAVAAVFFSVLTTVLISRGSGWLSRRFWGNAAIVSSLIMTFVLLWLTLDTAAQIRPGGDRVPPWTVINHETSLKWNAEKRWQVPVIGQEVGFFGKVQSPAEARALVEKGKLTIQSRDCMECHTFLGNGAYFAPDLTRAWLDPWWEERVMPMVGASSHEEAMKVWLQHSSQYPQGQRSMPDLGFTDEEAEAVVAFLKWMSAIDTNGYPAHFGDFK